MTMGLDAFTDEHGSPPGSLKYELHFENLGSQKIGHKEYTRHPYALKGWASSGSLSGPLAMSVQDPLEVDGSLILGFCEYQVRAFRIRHKYYPTLGRPV